MTSTINDHRCGICADLATHWPVAAEHEGYCCSCFDCAGHDVDEHGTNLLEDEIPRERIIRATDFDCPETVCAAVAGEWCFRWRTDLTTGEKYREIRGGLLTCSSRARLAERINRERRNSLKARSAQ